MTLSNCYKLITFLRPIIKTGKRRKRSVSSRNRSSSWPMSNNTRTLIGIGKIKQWFVWQTVIDIHHSPENNGVTRLGANLSQLKLHEISDTWVDVKKSFCCLVSAVSIFDIQIFNQLICCHLLFLVWHWRVRKEYWGKGACIRPKRNMQMYQGYL